MPNSSVLIISENKNIAELLSSKLILLRKSDGVQIIKYSDVEKISKENIGVIFVCSEEKKYLDILQKIKSNNALKNSTIILVMPEYNQEVILNSYELGVDDFLTQNCEDAEVLARSMLAINKFEMRKEIRKNNELLTFKKILDKNFGYITAENIDDIFSLEFEAIEKSKSSAIFMIISPDINSKKFLPQTFLASILKNTLRKDDLVGLSTLDNIYMLLKNLDEEEAKTIFDKIAASVPKNYSIAGVGIKVEEKSFENSESEVLKHLPKAILIPNNLLFLKKEKTPQNIIIQKQTNYRLFKQDFLTNYYKIIMPIFFQWQTILQEKLFETKVEQYVDESESVFRLKGKENKSYIQIKYPGYSKIQIRIVHEKVNDKKEELITVDRKDFSKQIIEKILEELVETFKKNQNV